MNRIQTVNLEEFASQYSFDNVSEADKYEYFSGYCYLAKYRPNSTVTHNDIVNINVGNGNDWGIDNLIILVNDFLVTEISTLQDYLKYDSSLRVKIIMVQAKTSTSLNTAELGNFLRGSRDMLAFIDGKRESLPPMNDKLKEKLEILDFIYSKANLFDKDDDFTMPRLHMYYVIGGENKTNDDAAGAIDDNRRSIEHMNLVQDLKCEIITANEICNLYQSTKTRQTCKFEVEHRMDMPKVEKIDQSHLCLIPFSEFKKIILDSDGKLIKSIFEDNVRDFQGENTVNRAMAESIRSGKIELFTAMNNGLTIIARKVTTQSTRFLLEDYQIVNGCQTCHVLYENRNIPGIDRLVLVVKIISSEDREIRDSIVVANNNQTEVKREQLISLLESQRNIENYYKAQNKFTRLYYERRSKQYSYGRENIKADYVITIPAQIMAYVSMVLGEPHLTSNYYGQIIEKFDGKNDSRKIFDPNSSPAFYYMSALAAFKRDRWLDNGKIHKELRHVKHHILYALSLVLDEKMPTQNSNKAEKYCEKVCAILCDEINGIELFNKAGELIKKTLGRAPVHNDLNDPTLAERIRKQYGQDRNKQEGKAETLSDNQDSKRAVDTPKLKGLKVGAMADFSNANSKRVRFRKKGKF